MRIERDDENDDGALNMTPLLDMMFILIIFFLATSRFQSDERDEAIRLVKSKSTMAIPTVSDNLVINVHKDGKKVIDGKERTLDQLEEFLRGWREEHPDAEVTVRTDREAYAYHLQEVTEICHRLGVKTPNISYAASGS